MTRTAGPTDAPVSATPVAPVASAPGEAAPAAPEEGARPERRSYRTFVIVGIVLVVVLAGALVWWLSTRGKESTDDAQVQADVVPLAPRAGGAVSRLLVPENAHVNAGEAVLQIDDADYAVKVQKATADLQVADATLARARSEAEFNARDLARAQALHARNAISEQDLEKAEVTARSSLAGVQQAEANVAAARASLESARLELSYTRVVAPADGRVSGITAHPGQILGADQPFAELVPDRGYVVANFKETQIGHMRPGQRASITLDAYGHRTLEGRVESLSAGTGAVFSLLPPTNATGNFVKVVQRVPVRVEILDPPPDLPLRAGLSADVTVFVR